MILHVQGSKLFTWGCFMMSNSWTARVLVRRFLFLSCCCLIWLNTRCINKLILSLRPFLKIPNLTPRLFLFSGLLSKQHWALVRRNALLGWSGRQWNAALSCQVRGDAWHVQPLRSDWLLKCMCVVTHLLCHLYYNRLEPFEKLSNSLSVLCLNRCCDVSTEHVNQWHKQV